MAKSEKIAIEFEAPTLARLIAKQHPKYLLLTPYDRLQIIQNIVPPDLVEVLHNKLEGWVTFNVCEDPYQDWWAFEKCCQAINGIIPHFFLNEPISPAQAAYCIYLINNSKLTNPSEEIYCYIAASAAHHGYVILPKMLAKADKILPELLSDIGLSIREDLLNNRATKEIMEEQKRKISIISAYLNLKLSKLMQERKLVEKW